MSNIKRHFRKRNLKTNLPLGATNIKKYQHTHYPKIQRYGLLPWCLCEFKLNFGDFGFADMLRMSHCILEKLMQICFPLKTSSCQFSLTPAQWRACQNTSQRHSSLFCPPPHIDLSIPLLSASSFFPPYSLCIFSISGDSLFLPLSWIDLLRKGASEKRVFFF